MKNAQEIFASLKEILLPYADKLIVVTDQENTFYLNTHHIMKNKQPMYFGSTAVKKNYVSFHLMPVYVFPELLTGLSPSLKKRMQGKSCFNFKTVDDALFKELKELTQASFDKFEQANYL